MKFRGFARVEQLVGVLQIRDLDAIDFMHHKARKVTELAGDRIAFNAGEDDDVFVFFKQAFGDVVGVKTAHGDIIKFGACEEVGVERLEYQTGENHVARGFLVFDGIHSRPMKGLERYVHVVPRSVAEVADGDLISGKFPFDDFVQIHFLAVDVHHAGAVHGFAVEREENVPGLEDAIGGTRGDDIGDENSLVVVRKADCLAHGGIVQRKLCDSEVGVMVIFPVLDVLEKSADDGCWDHVSRIVGLAEALESHSDDLVVLDDRAARVSGIDGSVDLDHQV